MSDQEELPPIPPALREYVRNPLDEKYTEEIFEDLHAVIDRHLVEHARRQGDDSDEETVVADWRKQYGHHVEKRLDSMEQSNGARLPYAFVEGEMKMAYLRDTGHPGYQDGAVPDGIIEVMQEFMEILEFRDEIEND